MKGWRRFSGPPCGCCRPWDVCPCSGRGRDCAPSPPTGDRCSARTRRCAGCITPPATDAMACCWRRSPARRWAICWRKANASSTWPRSDPIAKWRSRKGEGPMYTSCAFCNGKLDGDGGPSGLGVGRRFAYDEWRGRLWVICPKCARWNLTPLDDRLERIERLARVARDGSLVASTDQVALIRWQGYQLVRVGKPPRLELAPWRYGEKLRARRIERMKVVVPLTLAAVGIGIAANVAAGG